MLLHTVDLEKRKMVVSCPYQTVPWHQSNPSPLTHNIKASNTSTKNINEKRTTVKKQKLGCCIICVHHMDTNTVYPMWGCNLNDKNLNKYTQIVLEWQVFYCSRFLRNKASSHYQLSSEIQKDTQRETRTKVRTQYRYLNDETILEITSNKRSLGKL